MNRQARRCTPRAPGVGRAGQEVRVVDRIEQQGKASEDAVRPDESVEDAVRRGRWSATPFVLLGSVALTLWLVVGVVAGIVLLVWWLA